MKAKIEAANQEAVSRIQRAKPTLIDVSTAGEAVPGMKRNLILHAGPPVTWENMCGPMKGAVIGGLILEGLADHWEILIFIVGIVLIAVEIFAIPGFGVTGISGIVLVIAGLTLSLINNVGCDFSQVRTLNIITAFFLVIISIFMAIVASFFITRSLFSKNRLFGSLALETVQSKAEGYSASDSKYRDMVGKNGTAHSILRPSGKVMINEEIYDATAQTGYIDKGEPVEVVDYETTQLVVRKSEIGNRK